MKTYRPYAPAPSYLLPPSPGEWLPKGHLAYFILDLVAELDLKEIERRLQAKDHRGERPYAPRMMRCSALKITSHARTERIRSLASMGTNQPSQLGRGVDLSVDLELPRGGGRQRSATSTSDSTIDADSAAFRRCSRRTSAARRQRARAREHPARRHDHVRSHAPPGARGRSRSRCSALKITSHPRTTERIRSLVSMGTNQPSQLGRGVDLSVDLELHRGGGRQRSVTPRLTPASTPTPAAFRRCSRRTSAARRQRARAREHPARRHDHVRSHAPPGARGRSRSRCSALRIASHTRTTERMHARTHPRATERIRSLASMGTNHAPPGVRGRWRARCSALTITSYPRTAERIRSLASMGTNQTSQLGRGVDLSVDLELHRDGTAPKRYIYI